MAEPTPRIESSPPGRRFLAAQFDLPHLWGRRGFWQIRLRWAVAPLMVVGLALAHRFGFELPVVPILLIALASPVYNAAFAWIFGRFGERLDADPALDRAVVVVEVVVDYLAMLALLHFTGGASSPLVFFLIFHVIIGAVQFTSGTAYLFAALAAGGLWAMHLAHVTSWLPSYGLVFRGQPLHLLDRPAHATVFLLFFTASLFLTALLVSRIVSQLHRHVDELATLTDELTRLNARLQSLYTMVCAIGTERHLAPVLEKVTRELAATMEVPAVAVKLLSEDGATLRYVAAHGLPAELVASTVLRVAESPLDRRALEGETLVQGRVGAETGVPLHAELARLGIRSSVQVPLAVEGRVIGLLAIGADTQEHFGERDAEFLRLAAEIVALAIEDARANEAIENLMAERTQFMLKVAHNLRAPLSAGMSMLELIRGGDLGDVTPAQARHLARVDERLRALDRAIGQLLTIARARDLSREIPDVVVDMGELGRRTRRTFQEEARLHGLAFSVEVEPNLPGVDSGVDLLEELLENLVSNAIRYTLEGGEVAVRIGAGEPGEVRMTVRDTGIGIPEREQGKLFQEFFRASNAKRHSPAGTGLGLALVKQTVERHHGRIRLESAEGKGTTVTVEIPVRRVSQPLAAEKPLAEATLA
ncbi:MAG: DUF484 family protein [Thermoanaerobaculia bacterium]|nr:DUF484 family protein [Thermoanaerobaculia bacterium]